MQSSDTFVFSLKSLPSTFDTPVTSEREFDDLAAAANIISRARESFEELFVRKHAASESDVRCQGEFV